ncbi:MAG: response regulator [Cyclobacteriaceae bacterium]
MSKPTILYVDDMLPNINVFKITFKRDFNIITAEEAERAIELVKSDDIDLIIADQRMPGKTGVELMREVASIKPDLPKMIISEYSQDKVIRDAMKELGILNTIHKPWDRNELKAAILEAVS